MKNRSILCLSLTLTTLCLTGCLAELSSESEVNTPTVDESKADVVEDLNETSGVYWVIKTTVKEGQLDNLKLMAEEMVAATLKNEAGTLSYEWSLSEDGKTCYFFERYTDSASVMIHLGTFGEKFAERLMATVDIASFDVYGNPNQEVKDALTPFGAQFHVPLKGFAR